MDDPQRLDADNRRQPPPQSSNYLSDALQLAMSTALQLVDLRTRGTESKDDDSNSSSSKSAGGNLLKTSKPETHHLREISLDQVSWHDQFDDCWVVLYDRIYDVTEFLREHPGGADVLMEYAGRDATLAYRGFGHSAQAWQILQQYLIGVLPETERTQMFRQNERTFSFQLKAVNS